jgi:hypothetical protein
MAKPPPEKMTMAELAQEQWKRADSLDHLMAKAEMERRRTEAQLRGTKIMLASCIVASVSALGSAFAAAVAAYVAFRGVR